MMCPPEEPLAMVKEEIKERMDDLGNSLQVMLRYLEMRRAECDWHGVMDASADIRELLVEQRALGWVLELLKEEEA